MGSPGEGCRRRENVWDSFRAVYLTNFVYTFLVIGVLLESAEDGEKNDVAFDYSCQYKILR